MAGLLRRWNAGRDGGVRNGGVRSADLKTKLLSDERCALLADQKSRRVGVSAEVILKPRSENVETKHKRWGGLLTGQILRSTHLRF